MKFAGKIISGQINIIKCAPKPGHVYRAVQFFDLKHIMCPISKILCPIFYFICCQAVIQLVYHKKINRGLKKYE